MTQDIKIMLKHNAETIKFIITFQNQREHPEFAQNFRILPWDRYNSDSDGVSLIDFKIFNQRYFFVNSGCPSQRTSILRKFSVIIGANCSRKGSETAGACSTATFVQWRGFSGIISVNARPIGKRAQLATDPIDIKTSKTLVDQNL